MSEFPEGWFYIESDHNGHVLTVCNMTMQPSTRVELRPKKIGVNHQLWCYHQGYLVNKHSGCVLASERDNMKEQYVYQSKRSLEPSDFKKQIWKYHDKKLILTDHKKTLVEYALNNAMAPKLMNREEGSLYILKTPIK